MKIKRSNDIPEARVELVPLIDCVFLLLIFFMCAATMTKVDAPTDVRLPVASNGAEQKDPSQRGTVNVVPPGSRTPTGEIATVERPFLVFGQLMGDEGLQTVMTERLKVEPAMRLYLRADRNVKFAVVRRAMSACAAAGVADVIFATYERDLYLKDERP
ncbi:MAG: biopolymer transporter ExbD [Lentisphaerota bacterium]